MRDFSWKQWISIVVLIGLVALGVGMIAGRKAVKTESNLLEKPIVEKPEEPIYITIYVAGAVNNPDVYKLSSDSIVKDAIEKAGGAAKNADLVAINLARRVQDGEEIVVPVKQTQASDSGNTSSTINNGKININNASLEQLETLPGIGEVKGNAIIQYRKGHGLFKNIHDITRVSGIGEKTFEKIKDLIVIY